jgi:hypothetical protein
LAEQQHANDDVDNGNDNRRNNVHKNDDDDNNGNDNNVNNDNNGDNDDNSIYTPVHYLVNAINKTFPNIKMKPMTT